MRLPSVKTLSVVFQDNAKSARAILEEENTGKIHSPSVDNARKHAYHPHKKYYIRLLALSDLDNGLCGVESIETTNGEHAEYINAGDTYVPTIIYWRGSYRVQSIGDFIETMQRQSVHFI